MLLGLAGQPDPNRFQLVLGLAAQPDPTTFGMIQ